MLKLHFITSGILDIQLSNVHLGLVVKAPLSNLASYLTEPFRIYLEAKDMGYFTDWGIIELIPVKNDQPKIIRVMIDSQVWAWFGTADIFLERNGQIVFHENFQSGTKGPLGNPKRYRSYQVLEV